MGTAFTMFNAVWLVDQWDEAGGRIEEQLAYCKSFACAEAAYEAAIAQRPFVRITLRDGMRVMREHHEKWTPAAAEAHRLKEQARNEERQAKIRLLFACPFHSPMLPVRSQGENPDEH